MFVNSRPNKDYSDSDSDSDSDTSKECGVLSQHLFSKLAEPAVDSQVMRWAPAKNKSSRLQPIAMMSLPNPGDIRETQESLLHPRKRLTTA